MYKELNIPKETLAQEIERSEHLIQTYNNVYSSNSIKSLVLKRLIDLKKTELDLLRCIEREQNKNV